jgi:hypothetical protein
LSFKKFFLKSQWEEGLNKIQKWQWRNYKWFTRNKTDHKGLLIWFEYEMSPQAHMHSLALSLSLSLSLLSFFLPSLLFSTAMRWHLCSSHSVHMLTAIMFSLKVMEPVKHGLKPEPK